jgi:Flp pilus assembly protein TadD
LESQNLPLAREKLELAQAYVPGNAEINLALGNLWVEEHDPAKAESFYRATLAIEPRHKSALSNLGVLALQANRLPEAVSLFRAALAEEKNDAKTHYLLARAYQANGDLTGAVAEIQIALRLKPDQPEFSELYQRLRQQ